MIDITDIPALVQRMWLLHQDELGKFDNIAEYIKGERGKPHLPEAADLEVKEIRNRCVYNVLDMVVDAFVQNLSVIGYRNASAEDNAQGWDVWQRNQMDARQAEIYSAAVKYGAGYVVVTPGPSGPVFRPRSPRQLLAVYEDPQVDMWPQYALETWIDSTDGRPRRKGIMFDDTHMWDLDMGELPVPMLEKDEQVRRVVFNLTEDGIGDPIPHKAGVCPVVRYINRRDSEELVGGEIERLLNDQRAINEVNFDRMIVARFGAFPQKVITGWSGTAQEVLVASAKKTWTFDDEQVKAFTMGQASLEPYNALIEALSEHVAMRAQISPSYLTGGKIVNVGADAVAAAEANQQRKLMSMRESHGESHEQLLQLSAKMSGLPTDDASEVVWRDTEARSFGVMADGILKIGQALAAGLPIEPLLPLVPGLTQAMVAAIKRQAKTNQVTTLIQSLRPAAQAAQQDPQTAALAGQTGPAQSTPAVGTPDLTVRPMATRI